MSDIVYEVFSREEFLSKLRCFDGEAKWYTRGERVFITDSFNVLNVPFWDYAFSDELECIDWDKMGFKGE